MRSLSSFSRATCTTVKKPTRRNDSRKSNVLRDPQNFACLGTVVSRAKRSRRHARRRLRDATLYSPRDTPTRPLDRSTLSVRVETTRRVLRSRSETFYYETIYISFPQTIDIFLAQRNHLSLPHLPRAALFSGTAAPFHRRSSVSLPRKNASANSTTRWVFRREKHPLIKSKETPHLIVFFGVFFCSYFLQNACVFSVVFSLAPFPKSLQGLLRAFGGRRFRGVLFLFLVVVPSALFFTPSSREQKTSGTTQSALDALSYSAFLIDWNFSTQHTFCN